MIFSDLIGHLMYTSGDEAVLVDPMCGSGTILSEAALIARNAAPGMMRPSKHWPFRKWPDLDKKGMYEAVQEARDLARPWNGRLIGNDVHAVSRCGNGVFLFLILTGWTIRFCVHFPQANVGCPHP